MSSFTDSTAPISYNRHASDLLAKDVWNVARSFTYYTDAMVDRHWVTIPLGFLTDGASVPRVFWNLLPPWGQYGNAAIVHDYLCEHLTLTSENGTTIMIDRTTVDAVLNEAMTVLEVSAWKRIPIYAAVRFYFYLSKVVKKHKSPYLAALKSELEADFVAKSAVQST